MAEVGAAANTTSRWAAARRAGSGPRSSPTCAVSTRTCRSTRSATAYGDALLAAQAADLADESTNWAQISTTVKAEPDNKQVYDDLYAHYREPVPGDKGHPALPVPAGPRAAAPWAADRSAPPRRALWRHVVASGRRHLPGRPAERGSADVVTAIAHTPPQPMRLTLRLDARAVRAARAQLPAGPARRPGRRSSARDRACTVRIGDAGLLAVLRDVGRERFQRRTPQIAGLGTGGSRPVGAGHVDSAAARPGGSARPGHGAPPRAGCSSGAWARSQTARRRSWSPTRGSRSAQAAQGGLPCCSRASRRLPHPP